MAGNPVSSLGRTSFPSLSARLINRWFTIFLYTPHFVGSGSRREEKSIMRYAQSLAWLQKQGAVNLDHVSQVAPYVLWHRLKWTDEVQGRFRDHDRDDPLDLYITKLLLQEGTDEFPGVKRRFSESNQNYQRVLDLIKHGRQNEALTHARKCAASGKGHPIFVDTIKDLE